MKKIISGLVFLSSISAFAEVISTLNKDDIVTVIISSDSVSKCSESFNTLKEKIEYLGKIVISTSACQSNEANSKLEYRGNIQYLKH